MSSSRARRFAVAIFAMLSLLWAQMAVAGYVCPQQAAPAAMAGMVMTPGMPCDGMDKAQPALCHQAGDPTPPAADAVKLPTPSLPMIVQMLELPDVLDVGEAAARALPEAPDLRPPPDPLFLSTLRLRV
jgi:hypothetical protein